MASGHRQAYASAATTASAANTKEVLDEVLSDGGVDKHQARSQHKGDAASVEKSQTTHTS